MRKPLVERIYDKYAPGYSKGALEALLRFRARTAMSFGDDISWYFLKKYVPSNRSCRILDAGAGDGAWAERFVRLGYRNITLVDLSKGMLEEARKRFARFDKRLSLRFLKLDIANMTEIPSGFDYVFSHGDAVSVSYSMRPRRAIRELARVARRGANVVVSLDTKFRRVPELIQAHLVTQALRLLKTNISYDFGHPQYNLTWEELAEYYEEVGLEVIEVIGAPVFMHQVDEKILRKLEQNPKVRNTLLKIELQNCTNRSLVNLAGHLQMVGRKK